MPGYQNPNKTYTLVHISDPHIACMHDIPARQLLNKRLLGYLGWKLHRGSEHSEALLSVLSEDLQRMRPDHIAVTGDLTHLGLPAEFIKSRQWLQSLGPPDRVTVVPGNHDTYVRTAWKQSFAHWTDYMLSDNKQVHSGSSGSFDRIFPSLRIRDQIALIGVCTARPSAAYLAVGSIGTIQLQRLAVILSQTAKQRLFRVLLIHQPPVPGIVGWRKRLTDAAALRALLTRSGAELILHGHAHKSVQTSLKTPAGRVPVMGAPSASSPGRTPRRRARYYFYRVRPYPGNWDVRLSVRVYAPEEHRFVSEAEQHFHLNSPT